MSKLTAADVRAATHPGDRARPILIHDGKGLALQITKAGGKSWTFRYTIAGKAREMGLGPAATDTKEVKAGGVTLAVARERARAAKALLREGRDPLTVRDEARETARKQATEAAERTFRAAAEKVIEAKRPGWRSEKHAAQWAATLASYAYPKIGAKPVADIGTDDVLAVLRPVWSRAPETGSRLRQRIEAVLDGAKVDGWRTGENPARWKGHLEHQLAQPRKVKAEMHRPALPWQEVASFMAALEAKEGMAAKALRFAILTATRSGEVRGATWREIDLEAGVWTVPGARMKAGRTHRVPLSDAALAVLAEVADLRKGPDSHVFPGGRSGQALSDMALSMLVRGMACDGLAEGEAPRWRDVEGRAVVPHGFRSTFRDWAGEATAHPREVVEMALAHTLKDKAEAAYARSDLLERRRALMVAWAAHCARTLASVASIAEARAVRAGA